MLALFSEFLACLESNRHVLVETGAVSVFVQLLESEDEDVQFYCAAALSNLAVHGMHAWLVVM